MYLHKDYKLCEVLISANAGVDCDKTIAVVQYIRTHTPEARQQERIEPEQRLADKKLFDIFLETSIMNRYGDVGLKHRVGSFTEMG